MEALRRRRKSAGELARAPLSRLFLPVVPVVSKSLAYRFFGKQLAQLIKTTSSLPPHTGSCGCFAVRALRSPNLIALRQAHLLARAHCTFIAMKQSYQKSNGGATTTQKKRGRVSPPTSLKVVLPVVLVVSNLETHG